MTIQFFLTYIGIFFAGTLATVMLVRSMLSSFANSKKPLIYGGLSSLLVSIVAFGTSWITPNLFIVFWILTGIFLLFGILYLMMLHRKYFSGKHEDQLKNFGGELIFACSMIFFTIVLFSSLQYFLNDKNYMFYPLLLSALIFFVPMLVLQTFQMAYAIPPAVFTTWSYPSQPIELPDDNGNEKLLVIAFEISKKESDTNKSNFRAKAPEQIVLGELYYHFINDYNELQSETPIQYADATNNAYQWWFRIKPKWYQRPRILDPFQTIAANGIQENSIIVCERVAV